MPRTHCQRRNLPGIAFTVARWTALLVAGAGLAACAKQELPILDETFPLTVAASGESLAPRLTQYEGRTTLSWLERSADGGATLMFTDYELDRWGAARHVVTDPAMFVNWADRPGVASLGGERYLAWWLSRSADETYAYGVRFAVSDDGGESWGPSQLLHDDATDTEHGFVSIYPASDGVGMLWLDGRNTPAAPMTLRAASIAPDGTVIAAAEIDAAVCDCCATDVAATTSGALAVYRDRSDTEVRDIRIARRTASGWQDDRAVANDGWVIDGCPVNGPAVDAAGDRVVVAWFTAANGESRVFVATSDDSGEHFGAAREIAAGDVLGQVDVAIVDDDAFVVTWLQPSGAGDYDIKLRSLTWDGQETRARDIGKTSLARSVPRMQRVGDRLLFAWTDRVADQSQVVAAQLLVLDQYE